MWENTNPKLNSITAATINIISVAFKIISEGINGKEDSHTRLRSHIVLGKNKI